MLKIDLNSQDINKFKNLYNLKINKGAFGTVLPYENGLGLKFYNGLIDSDFSNNALYTMKAQISEAQIELLSRKQKDIKLTNLPLGIAYYNDVPAAVIIKYFSNHSDLLELCKEHNTVVIGTLQKLLYIVDELIKNGIYQLDIKETNFLFSKLDYSVQAIDLDGPLIRIGRENIAMEEDVYESLESMFFFLIKEKLLYDRNNNIFDENDYKCRIDYLRSLKRSIYVYESLQGFINNIKDNRLLDSPKKIFKR